MNDPIAQYKVRQPSDVWAANAASRIIENLAHAVTDEAAAMVPAAIAAADDKRDPAIATWADEFNDVGESPSAEEAILRAVMDWLYLTNAVKHVGYTLKREMEA